eukprot:PhM_4_TR14212/c4_g1_i1/m.101620
MSSPFNTLPIWTPEDGTSYSGDELARIRTLFREKFGKAHVQIRVAWEANRDELVWCSVSAHLAVESMLMLEISDGEFIKDTARPIMGIELPPAEHETRSQTVARELTFEQPQDGAATPTDRDETPTDPSVSGSR